MDPFLSLNCVQTSVGVPFGYRKSLEWIRRMKNVTIYAFRQVHLEPVKNAMLSPVKTFDRNFNRKHVFYPSEINTDISFWLLLQHNNDPKRTHSQKIIVYRLKKNED